MYTIGLLGFGRIGQAIYDRICADPEYDLGYVLVRSEIDELPKAKQVTDPSRLSMISVDLCVEVATPKVVTEVGPTVLNTSDLAILSAGALATPDTMAQLTDAARENGTTIVLPHAALLGIDGLVDAKEALTTVTIETTKHPDDIDFGFTEDVSPTDISEPTELFDGPVREICRLLPRSFNSHAVVALASLGLDDTRSTLIADPTADRSVHVIKASGEQFSLCIERESAIGDVAGNYTHLTVWGSIQRLLNDNDPVTFI